MQTDSIIYAQLTEPQKIDFLSKIIEAYGHLGIVSTIDAKSGIILIRTTPSTKEQVETIISNLPFEITRINNYTPSK